MTEWVTEAQATSWEGLVPDFGRRFMESHGLPIEHGGKMLIMLDEVPAKLGDRFLVTIERTSSPYPQGVGVCDGVEVFGERARRAVIWEYFSLPPDLRETERSRLPFSFEVTCRNKRGSLSFYNMAEYRGRQEWWHGGSCMIAERIAGGHRYHCNDFEMDEDFDDMVFSVVRRSGVSPHAVEGSPRREEDQG